MNKDVVFCPREDVMRAVEEFPTPFFLYSEERLRANCARFRDAFRKYFPDFQPLFAVKANPNPDVLRVVIDEGFEFDASSETEAWLGEKLGTTGMYTGNYTTPETLAYAKERGFILNLDDIENVAMLEKIGVPETVSFRINPGVGNATMENNVFAGPDAKYGVPFEKAVEAYRQAKELGVKEFGIHMMTGSNVPLAEQDYFAQIVEKLFEVVAEVKREVGVEISYMNIGGGFGVPYRPEEGSLNLDRLAAGIREVFDAQCEKHGLNAPRLMAEPGRYIGADAGWLVGRVVLIKESYKKFVGIDASSNDMPRPSIYDAYHHVSVLNDVDERESVSVVGSICENSDQFAKDRELPVASVGDVVAIHNCGAHAYAMGHNYNGKLKHAELMIGLDGTVRQVRAPQTIEELYRGTNI